MKEQELNTSVALSVMEFKKQTFKGQDGYSTSNGLVFLPHFNPVQDIQDSWKVLDKLKEKQIHFRMTDKGSGYVVELWHEFKHTHIVCEEETIGKAICTAALNFVWMLKAEGTESDPWTAKLA